MKLAFHLKNDLRIIIHWTHVQVVLELAETLNSSLGSIHNI